MDRPSASQALFLDAEFFWLNLAVGDSIAIEQDWLDEQGFCLLPHDRYYQVLAICGDDPGHMGFIVQSPLDERLVTIHPGFVSDYQLTKPRTSVH